MTETVWGGCPLPIEDGSFELEAVCCWLLTRTPILVVSTMKTGSLPRPTLFYSTLHIIVGASCSTVRV